MALTVGKLAEMAGLTPDAVRYYERMGLLPEPERSQAGYRLFDEGYLERLRFIKGARRIGLRLREVGELLHVLDRGLCPCGHTERMIRERIAEMDGEIARLRGLRKRLVVLVERLPSAGDRQDASPWPCEQEFIRVGGGADSGS